MDFCDSEFFRAQKGDFGSSRQNKIDETLLFLAICHTVVTEIDKSTGELKYNASSPDELALLSFARYAGCVFEGIDEENIMKI